MQNAKLGRIMDVSFRPQSRTSQSRIIYFIKMNGPGRYSFNLCNRRKTLTGSLDPTYMQSANKPCKNDLEYQVPIWVYSNYRSLPAFQYATGIYPSMRQVRSMSGTLSKYIHWIRQTLMSQCD